MGKATVVIKSLGTKKKFTRLLGDAAHKKNFRAGLVMLNEGESVGEHSTENKEEALIILEGKAGIICGKRIIKAGRDNFIYIPPKTKHNLKNTGKGILKYIYITSKKD